MKKTTKTNRHLLWDLVHEGPVSVPELGDLMGVEEWTVHQKANRDNNVYFPAEWLAQFMTAQENYDFLYKLGADCGKIVIDIPPSLKKAMDAEELRLYLEESALEAVKHLREHHKEPESLDKQRAAQQSLKGLMKAASTASKQVGRNGQIGLFDV